MYYNLFSISPINTSAQLKLREIKKWKNCHQSKFNNHELNLKLFTSSHLVSEIMIYSFSVFIYFGILFANLSLSI